MARSTTQTAPLTPTPEVPPPPPPSTRDPMSIRARLLASAASASDISIFNDVTLTFFDHGLGYRERKANAYNVHENGELWTEFHGIYWSPATKRKPLTKTTIGNYASVCKRYGELAFNYGGDAIVIVDWIAENLPAGAPFAKRGAMLTEITKAYPADKGIIPTADQMKALQKAPVEKPVVITTRAATLAKQFKGLHGDEKFTDTFNEHPELAIEWSVTSKALNKFAKLCELLIPADDDDTADTIASQALERLNAKANA